VSAIPDRAYGLPRADPAIIERNLDRVWILSDTHFWHDNIVVYHNRPEDHTQLMIRRWRELVPRDGLVLHLGDVVHGIPTQELWSRFPRLPGRIHLVPGNHDRLARVEVFIAAGWVILDPFSFAYRDHHICFTHEPMPEEELLPGSINVHGHIHSQPAPSPRHLNTCVEMLDYSPVPLRPLIDAKIAELDAKAE